jgi:predicted CoA-binding protein
MYPWLWLWAPQVNFPWSGDVAQEIEPTTSWFFRGIRPAAGDAEIEEKAFSVASYGKQLGLITEVLIDVAERIGTQSVESTESMNRLKLIREAIDQIKTVERTSRVPDIVSQVAEVKRKGGSEYAQLSRTLLPLLAGPGP